MPTQVYLLFDERMALHRPITDGDNHEQSYFFENPDRIYKVYGGLLDLERRLVRNAEDEQDDCNAGICPHYEPRFVKLKCRPILRKTVELVHTREHYDWLYHTSFMTDEALRQLSDPDDLYICQSTFMASSLACGGVVDCVNAVTEHDGLDNIEKRITRAIALVRPPGHHAERDHAMGASFICCWFAFSLTILSTNLVSVSFSYLYDLPLQVSASLTTLPLQPNTL